MESRGSSDPEDACLHTSASVQASLLTVAQAFLLDSGRTVKSPVPFPLPVYQVRGGRCDSRRRAIRAEYDCILAVTLAWTSAERAGRWLLAAWAWLVPSRDRARRRDPGHETRRATDVAAGRHAESFGDVRLLCGQTE